MRTIKPVFKRNALRFRSRKSQENSSHKIPTYAIDNRETQHLSHKDKGPEHSDKRNKGP